MSAVIAFPGPLIKPDVDALMPFLERAGNDGCILLELAQMSMRAIEVHQRRGEIDLRACQGIMNAATMVFLAMGTFVGTIPPSGEGDAS